MRISRRDVPVVIDVPGAVARQKKDFGDAKGYGAIGGEYFSLGAGTDIAPATVTVPVPEPPKVRLAANTRSFPIEIAAVLFWLNCGNAAPSLVKVMLTPETVAVAPPNSSG